MSTSMTHENGQHLSPKTQMSRRLDLRGKLGWALRDAGWALVHAGDRALGEGHTSLEAEYAAGLGFGERRAKRRSRQEWLDGLTGVLGFEPDEAAQIVDSLKLDGREDVR